MSVECAQGSCPLDPLTNKNGKGLLCTKKPEAVASGFFVGRCGSSTSETCFFTFFVDMIV